MDGTIFFPDLESLATFLKELVPCSAVFEVHPWASPASKDTGWLLRFTGGF